jgi:hypothetical protein
MRGRIGQILDAADAGDAAAADAQACGPADVTLRRFWSHGPGVKRCGERAGQVVDLAAWKKAARGVAR